MCLFQPIKSNTLNICNTNTDERVITDLYYRALCTNNKWQELIPNYILIFIILLAFSPVCGAQTLKQSVYWSHKDVTKPIERSVLGE